MKAEILAVGTELLLGDILNTNAQYLSKQLALLGIDVHFQTVVGDNPQRLEEAVFNAFSRADIIITSGGLGPTEDDLTKETCSKYFGRPFVKDEKALEMLEDFFSKINRKMTPNNLKQVMVPKGSVVMYNKNGTAPGIIVEGKGKILVMLPGPPRELKPMFEEYVMPFLGAKQEFTFVSRMFRFAGVGESEAENIIKDMLENQTNPTLATYVKGFEVAVRVTAKAKTKEEANILINPVGEELHKRFGIRLYAEGDTNIAEVTCKKLLEKNLTIAVAESCTGGLLSSGFVDFDGISRVFLEGDVAYSNGAKIRSLGVKPETLEKHGAVSAETAMEMARGIAEKNNSHIGLSTTGVAGPSGGTEEKPVGTVFLGMYYKGEVKAKQIYHAGNRERIRIRTVEAAFDWLRREIEKREGQEGTTP